MKKVITGFVMLAGFMGAVFASPIPQTSVSSAESLTSASTAGIFGTDVDDYINVIEWQNVKPKNFFGFVGVGGGEYDMGGAHQFGKAYWGTNFAGQFGKYSSTKYSGSGDSGTISPTPGEGANGVTKFRFDNLIGVGNIGITPGFKYYDAGSSQDDSADPAEKTEAQGWQISVAAGTSFEKDENKLSPYGKVWYGYNYDEMNGANYGTKVKDGANTTCSEFGLLGGVKIELKKKTDLKHVFDLSAIFTGYFPASDSGVEKGASLVPKPYYTLTYEPEDSKFGLGAKFGLPSILYFGEDNFFSFFLLPEIYTGAYYKATDKLKLNAGMQFALVSFTYAHSDVSGYKTDSVIWDGNDGSVTITSGFTYSFNEKVNLDFSWNILSAIFGTDFESDFSQASTSDAFWGNMNKIFTNMALMIDVKL